MLGSPNLTHQSAKQLTTAPGMAFWAGTGPAGKTCEDCVFKNYQYVVRNHANLIVRSPNSKGCRKFYELSGTHGPAFSSEMSACKYFEKKPVK